MSDDSIRHISIIAGGATIVSCKLEIDRRGDKIHCEIFHRRRRVGSFDVSGSRRASLFLDSLTIEHVDDHVGQIIDQLNLATSDGALAVDTFIVAIKDRWTVFEEVKQHDGPIIIKGKRSSKVAFNHRVQDAARLLGIPERRKDIMTMPVPELIHVLLADYVVPNCPVNIELIRFSKAYVGAIFRADGKVGKDGLVNDGSVTDAINYHCVGSKRGKTGLYKRLGVGVQPGHKNQKEWYGLAPNRLRRFMTR